MFTRLPSSLFIVIHRELRGGRHDIDMFVCAYGRRTVEMEITKETYDCEDAGVSDGRKEEGISNTRGFLWADQVLQEIRSPDHASGRTVASPGEAYPRG